MSKNLSSYDPKDFLLSEYKKLINLAKTKYIFSDYESYDRNQNFILWRHDVDFSPRLVSILAEIEFELGVSATYFFLLRSEFYNLFSPSSLKVIRMLQERGHKIGLHFDASSYDIQDEPSLIQALESEKIILERFIGKKVNVFSFHNTNVYSMSCQNYSYAGMVNTYANYFQTEVGYCSDSNGCWRHERLMDVIQKSKYKNLQALTHPIWWSDKLDSPWQKVQNILEDKVTFLQDYYETLLEQAGRENIK